MNYPASEIAKSIRAKSLDGRFVLTDEEAARMVELFAKVVAAHVAADQIANKPVTLPGVYPFFSKETAE